MKNKRNIFHKISKKNEDSTTELLVTIMTAGYVKNIVLETMGVDKDISKIIQPNQIVTQNNIENIGRPDIVIENTKVKIFIENKIRRNTSLQNTQTTTYLEELKKSNKDYIKMIYLIPSEYEHIDKIVSATNENNICSIVTWDQILNELYENNISKWNPVLDESLEHLSELILKREAGINLTIEEVAMIFNPKDLINANSLFIKTKKLINKIDPLLVNSLGSDFASSSWAWDNNEAEMGKYVGYKKDQYAIFYGFNFGISKEHPDFIFGVAIAEYLVNLKEKKDYIEQNGISDGDWYFFKIDKYALINFDREEEIKNEIINIIKNTV